MKLISCYIENFGGLSRFSLDFAEGLTVIQQPNGFGKTTLAEFIRAMFYGFPKKPPKQMGRRQKYRPWNGKKCGGHLTFEHEGERYRIERTFGATPKGDICRIFDLKTGQETKRFGDEVGLEIFGLDADSFERSTYLPQNRETGSLTTDSIRAKLGNLVEDTGDVNNYEKALNALHAKRSAYIPYRGSGGTVAEATARITRLQRELDSAEDSRRAMAETVSRLAELEQDQNGVTAEIASVRSAIETARKAESILAHYRHRDRLTADLEAANTRLEELNQKYPKGFPSREDLEAVSDAVEQAVQLSARTVVTEEDQRARRFVEIHQERFADGVPSQDEFDEMYRCRDHRRDLEIQLNAAVLPESDAEELEALERFFAPGIPGEDVLERHAEIQAEIGGLQAENRHLGTQTAQVPRYKVPSPLTVPLLLGFGGAGMLAGVFLLLRDMPLPGGLALGLGVMALIAAACLRSRIGAASQVRAFNPQVQQIIRENDRKIAELEAAMVDFASAYGGAAPGEIRQKISRLSALRSREAALSRKRRTLTEAWDADDAALRAFFARHSCESGDAYEVLNRLRRSCEAWERAQKQLADLQDRENQHRREKAEVRRIMEAFREKYDLLPRNRSQILAIRDDARTYREQTEAVRVLNDQLARHCREYAEDLALPVPEIREDPKALERREKTLQARQNTVAGELLQLQQRARRLEEAAERIPELRDEMAACQEKKEADRQRAALLDDTQAFLQQAKDNLATAYMGNIRQNFAGLMARMTGEDSEKILVTPELEVRLERAGVSRELTYFSAGQTDLVMLCMRLALVDALFREAKPFVILDDPFVNLDDERTREALALLQELSRDRQILYLVCNSSRVS